MNALDHYQQLYQQHRNNLPGHHANWLRQSRERALQNFMAHGLPNNKTEQWKYTTTDHLIEFPAKIATKKNIIANTQQLHAQLSNIMHDDCDYLIFVNGFFWEKKITAPIASSANIVINSLAEQILKPGPNAILEDYFGCLNNNPPQKSPLPSFFKEDDGHGYFIDLNTCLWQDGAFIYLPRNSNVTKPLHIIYATTTDAAHHHLGLRNFIYLESSSTLTLLEHYVYLDTSDGLPEANLAKPYFHNSVTEIFLSDHAQCQHYQFTEQAAASYHFGHSSVRQQTNSHYHHFTLSLTGNWQRHQLDNQLCEPQATTQIHGLFIANGQQLSNHHANIRHSALQCSSGETLWGVADDAAKVVLHAKTIVTPGADQTSSQQHNKNLLLSNQAEIDTQPELEIYAKNVQCTHGATVGQLAADALFYMTARGIPEDVAKQLLLQGFAGEFLSLLPSIAIKQLAHQKISSKFDSMVAAPKKDVIDVI